MLLPALKCVGEHRKRGWGVLGPQGKSMGLRATGDIDQRPLTLWCSRKQKTGWTSVDDHETPMLSTSSTFTKCLSCEQSTLSTSARTGTGGGHSEGSAATELSPKA